MAKADNNRISPLVASAMTPISDAARAVLRSARVGGGRIELNPLREHLISECRKAGYLHVGEGAKTGRLTGLGQAYLDMLMRAH